MSKRDYYEVLGVEKTADGRVLHCDEHPTRDVFVVLAFNLETAAAQEGGGRVEAELQGDRRRDKRQSTSCW